LLAGRSTVCEATGHWFLLRIRSQSAFSFLKIVINLIINLLWSRRRDYEELYKQCLQDLSNFVIAHNIKYQHNLLIFIGNNQRIYGLILCGLARPSSKMSKKQKATKRLYLALELTIYRARRFFHFISGCLPT
jgi:hypothetical protein